MFPTHRGLQQVPLACPPTTSYLLNSSPFRISSAFPVNLAMNRCSSIPNSGAERKTERKTQTQRSEGAADRNRAPVAGQAVQHPHSLDRPSNNPHHACSQPKPPSSCGCCPRPHDAPRCILALLLSFTHSGLDQFWSQL